MADPAREKAIEACRAEAKEASYRPFFAPCDPKLDAQRTERMLRFGNAATLLTRDGRLRERAMELIQQWRQGRAFIILATECADELEAALKEDEK